MGIILNDGVAARRCASSSCDFAAGTPYETSVAPRRKARREQVLAPEIAARRAARSSTSSRRAPRAALKAALAAARGRPAVVGGKTGTGDHRYESFAPGGRLIESRVVSRTATFAFLIGDRFFGTLTAYVAGPDAARYQFTSALPVRLLAILTPALSPLLDNPEK